MRSVRPRLEIPLAVGVAVALAGCVSTQQKNARLVLLNERTLASQTSVRVTRSNPQVAVTRVALVRGSGGAAVAVTLRNLAAHPLSDLPISVGVVSRKGVRSYFNRATNLGYLDTHIPALGSGATITWVLPLRRGAQPAGRPFADVGFARIPASTRDTSLPAIDVSLAAVAGGSDALEVTVANRSGVPQTDMAVYAVVSRGGRYVAAGRTTIGQLSGGAHRTLHLALLGSAGAKVALFAPPTIFN